jgi:hypothetical protein
MRVHMGQMEQRDSCHDGVSFGEAGVACTTSHLGFAELAPGSTTLAAARQVFSCVGVRLVRISFGCVECVDAGGAVQATREKRVRRRG